MKMCQIWNPPGSLGSFTFLCPLRWPCLCCSWAVPHSWSQSLWSAQWQPGLPPMLWLHKPSISWEWKCHIYLDHLDSFMWVFPCIFVHMYIWGMCVSHSKIWLILNNRLVPNRKRSTLRLYIVTLLIYLICRVHHEKCWTGRNTSWNQDCREKYQ